MASKLLKDIPGYARAITAARRRETFTRLAAFLPQDRRVAGIPILPLSLGHYQLLWLIGSPLLIAGPAGPVDCTNFLWIVSPDFLAPGGQVTRAEAKKARVLWLAKYGTRLLRTLERPNGLANIAKRIRAEVDEAFHDCSRSSEKSPNAHAVTFAAAIVDEFAAAYGWPREAITATPLSILFQLRRATVVRENPGTVLGSASDRAGKVVVRRHLEREKAKAARAAKTKRGAKA